jgi:hypothetical protein
MREFGKLLKRLIIRFFNRFLFLKCALINTFHITYEESKKAIQANLLTESMNLKKKLAVRSSKISNESELIPE